MVEVAPSFWLTQWNLAPSILIGTALIMGIYLYAVGLLRKPYKLIDGVTGRQVTFFYLGVLVIFFALVSPLDEIGDRYLFYIIIVSILFIRWMQQQEATQRAREAEEDVGEGASVM